LYNPYVTESSTNKKTLPSNGKPGGGGGVGGGGPPGAAKVATLEKTKTNVNNILFRAILIGVNVKKITSFQKF